MNPLTQIKNTQKASQQEIARGVGDSASWHARFKHSAYIFTGGLSYDLTEGDLLAVFSQYGEIVDVNLVRDKDTGKSRGFAFLAYEDQRSTVLAVDNLSGGRVAGRVISVNHVDNYKVKRAEMEGREVSPDTEPEDDAEPEDVRPLPAAEGAGAAQTAAPTGGGDAPWGNSSNSVFALLNSADAMPPPPPRPTAAVAVNGGGGPKKEKRYKKEKKEKKAKHGQKAKVDRPGHASSDSEDGRPAARRSPARGEPVSHHRSVPAPAPSAADQLPDRAAGASRRHEEPERDRAREDRIREHGVDRDAQRDGARRRSAERMTGRDRKAGDRRSDAGRSRRDDRREHRPRSRSRSPRRR